MIRQGVKDLQFLDIASAMYQKYIQTSIGSRIIKQEALLYRNVKSVTPHVSF